MSSNPYTRAFFEAQSSGSLSSARTVLSQLFSILEDAPQRVIDIGCGAGTWLRAALDLGATSVRGFDGDWVDRSQLQIPRDQFTVCDLLECSKNGSLPGVEGSFDLAISVEVAEHLPPKCARGLVRLLCKQSDLIVFSAAIPYQGGVDHVNEAWPSVWSALFREENFECFDILRDLVWLSPNVDWWYAQNLLVFARAEQETRLRTKYQATNEPLPRIHPRKYLLQVATELELRQALGAATAAPFPSIMPLPPYMAPLERKLAALRSALASREPISERASHAGALLETISLYDKLRSQAFEWLRELGHVRQECVRLQNELNKRLQGTAEANSPCQTTELRTQLQVALQEAADSKRTLRGVLSSNSWKVTAPLRALGKMARSVLRQKP